MNPEELGVFLIVPVYIALGYLALANLRGTFDFGRTLLHKIVFSFLFGWIAIPIAFITTFFSLLFKFLSWLLRGIK